MLLISVFKNLWIVVIQENHFEHFKVCRRYRATRLPPRPTDFLHISTGFSGREFKQQRGKFAVTSKTQWFAAPTLAHVLSAYGCGSLLRRLDATTTGATLFSAAARHFDFVGERKRPIILALKRFQIKLSLRSIWQTFKALDRRLNSLGLVAQCSPTLSRRAGGGFALDPSHA